MLLCSSIDTFAGFFFSKFNAYQNSRYLILDFMNHHRENERACNAQKEFTILNASRAPLISVDTRSSPISIHALNIKEELILKLPGSKITITQVSMIQIEFTNRKYPCLINALMSTSCSWLSR